MQSSASASDPGKNVACFGRPNERLGFGVMHGDVIVDGRFEVSEAGEHAATNALVGDVSEETLDHIQPGRTGGSEMDVEALVLGHPLPVSGDRADIRARICSSPLLTSACAIRRRRWFARWPSSERISIHRCNTPSG